MARRKKWEKPVDIVARVLLIFTALAMGILVFNVSLFAFVITSRALMTFVALTIGIAGIWEIVAWFRRGKL